MSAYNAYQKIELEARERRQKDLGDAFELEIHTKSGRRIEGAALKSDSYYLKLEETLQTKKSPTSPETRVTYLPWDGIEQITPIWL